VSTRSWLAVGYLSAFGSIVGFTAYVWLLRVVPASRVATYAYVNPVIAMILGWSLAGEHFTMQMLVAALVIVVAVFLIITNQTKRPLRAETGKKEAVPQVQAKEELVAE
jgi:drug/metabolite transporter (DMT)-like permease